VTNREDCCGRLRPNADLRTREYLTDAEVARLQEAAAKANRYGHRDATMVLVAYRHGLRVSELVDLRWDQIDVEHATMAMRRAKKGTPGIHGLQGDELRLLRALRREHPHADFVFLSERKAPLSVKGAQKHRTAWRGRRAAISNPCSHANALAARGIDTRTLQAFMGHRSISNTVVCQVRQMKTFPLMPSAHPETVLFGALNTAGSRLSPESKARDRSPARPSGIAYDAAPRSDRSGVLSELDWRYLCPSHRHSHTGSRCGSADYPLSGWVTLRDGRFLQAWPLSAGPNPAPLALPDWRRNYFSETTEPS
jgi:Phage integrase family